MSDFFKKVKISDKKSVDITPFKRQVWVHIRDDRKNKSVSLSKAELIQFINKVGKIRTSIKDCERAIVDGQQKGRKKQKEKSKKKLDESSDSESAPSDSDAN